MNIWALDNLKKMISEKIEILITQKIRIYGFCQNQYFLIPKRIILITPEQGCNRGDEIRFRNYKRCKIHNSQITEFFSLSRLA